MKRCKHCGVEIRWMNYSIGAGWHHCPPGTNEFSPASAYSPYRHCKLALVAEPAEADDECASCPHTREDHGDGVIHAACCAIDKVPVPSGDVDHHCECVAFEPKASA